MHPPPHSRHRRRHIDTFIQQDRRLRQQHPLPYFLAPWGWCFAKNNLLDATPAVLEDVADPDVAFLLRDLYFGGMVFYANGDFALRHGERVRASLYVHYAPAAACPYELSLHLRKGTSRNSAHQLDLEHSAATARDACTVINTWMAAVSGDFVDGYNPAADRMDDWFSAASVMDRSSAC
ncbi:MAG: hypothetical protein GAK31_01565 [Stenotrophomonas maltophilia]|uniref:Uncharacterized protein n=1 Tax=Stenotrophomonas maltophilia TaxID=40324 RepID=A0A7V8FHZ9_STEMA|nr:MAG: hypothetical protein GAK31_01565 [Stenotrophomonas maltophilia]